MKKLILLAFISLSSLTNNAQITETDNQMFWGIISLNKKIDKKMSVSYLQLNSVDINSGKFNFIQSEFSFNYKLKKRLISTLAYSPTFSLDGIAGNQFVYHRLAGKIKLKTKVLKRLYMSNSIVGEYHFTERSKWRQRYYYRLDFEYKNNRKLPWKIRPFVSQKIYWYQNGRLLQYYDDLGNKTDLKSPNGLHAYRIKTGVKLSPLKKWNFIVYYQKQKEFNTSIFGSSDINNINTNNNKIRRSFYDFSVIGFSCNYKL